jgi:hypothetical protein
MNPIYKDCCPDICTACSASLSTAYYYKSYCGTGSTTTVSGQGSCSQYGCGSYKAGRNCQCDKACMTYGDCCTDLCDSCITYYHVTKSIYASIFDSYCSQ